MHILVVDDEKLLVKGLKFNLENEGYTVSTAYDGEAAVELVQKEHFDLVLLDLMMPKLGGLEACVRIRSFSSVPIIILTAKGEDMDKLFGFECGADDYVTKPFNILELKARVRALLRRSGSSEQTSQSERISVGPISVEPLRRAALRDGVTVELTEKEYDLLELLLKNPGRVYSREALLDAIWGSAYKGDGRTVDVHVHRLRDKLELSPSEPEWIMTKWGVGYYFKEA